MTPIRFTIAAAVLGLLSSSSARALAQGEPAAGERAAEAADQADAGTEGEPGNPADETPDVELEFELGKGLVARSSDRRFQLGIRPRVQLLGTTTVPEAGDDPTLGAEIRRARVVFEGHVLGPENRFKLELAVSPRDMGMVELEDGTTVATRTPLLDFYVELRHLRDLEVRIGRYKVPYNRERVISSGDLALVDRSIVNGELNLDRDVGFDLRSRDFLGLGLLRYYAGVYGAEGRDAFRMDELGLMYLGRIEVLPLGMFDDYEMVDFEREKRARLSIGASYAFVDEAPGNAGILGDPPADGGTTDYHNLQADLLFQLAGFSLLGEVLWRGGDRSPGGALDDAGAPVPVEPPRDGLGYFVQPGYLLPTADLEIAARYGRIEPIGSPTETSLDERGELGIGLSYYFAQHAFKLQGDYFHLWGEQALFHRGEERIRIQLQASL